MGVLTNKSSNQADIVSILMPLYNAEKWLAQTIESVLAQTYFNWELIIVDDGSIDNSYEVAQSFAKKDNRIKIYSQKNKGACAARNKAFELSNGEFIQYLDADDLLSNNKIELQLKALKSINDENAIANCSWEKFQKKVGDIQNQNQKVDKNYDEPVNWLIDSWLGGGHGQTNCWLVPKHIVEKAGKWDESLTVNQDGEFFCRVLLQASQIVFVDEVKVYYRMDNSNSISQQSHSKIKVESLLNSYFMYEKHLTNHLSNDFVKKGILKNYLSFLSQYDRYYTELSEKVWPHIEDIGVKNFEEVVSIYGNKLSRLIGFKNYLKLARIKVKINKFIK